MYKHIEKTKLDEKLQEAFGSNTYSEEPLAPSGAGHPLIKTPNDDRLVAGGRGPNGNL
ncbi:MAG: hypothetical protein QGG64_19475 [Candidatus Latescibacteria bacterium]|jgi:hypothetical protein|nr:hypothetical protein [Candidatus Latescibacterota bacterium]